MDEKINLQIPDSSISEIASSVLPLPISSQNISSLAESAVYFSSTSSPKVPIYNNHVVGDQRYSPSVNPSLKRVLSRSGTPSSSNASLHLKIGTPNSTAGDVYDFHSSPEEDNVSTSNSGFFVPSTGGVLQPKSSSSMQNLMIESYQPPQKRIKTAILAKKLLAAAADSNIIDSVGLAQSNGTANKSALEEYLGHETEEAQKETEEIREGLFEDDEEEELEEQDEAYLDERAQIRERRTDSATSVLAQEQKKVPPLRISLLKTPRTEGDFVLRITRSRVRQIATNANVDGMPSLDQKRRFRPMVPGSEASEAGGGTENAGDDERDNDDQRSEEDSRHSAPGIRTTTDSGGGDGKSEGGQLQKRQSMAASILSKNSLEQSAAFEAMIRERWALQYKEHLRDVTERVESANLSPNPVQNQETIAENNFFEGNVTKDWPELLQKLYSEQSNRSREMADAHRLDRERIRTMMQREMAKASEAQRQAKAVGERRSHFITAVSLLRDSECYDPAVFAERATRRVHTPSLAQSEQRFNYLVNTTKNRHAMEAQTLAENHKAEWNRTLRKIVRENERRQLLKGSAGAKQLIQLPPECCRPLKFKSKNVAPKAFVGHWYDVDHRFLTEEAQRHFVPLQLDDETNEFLHSSLVVSNSICLQIYYSFVASLLSVFLTKTSINGLLDRGRMFIFSHAHVRAFLALPDDWSPIGRRMLDIGAGDGEVTAKFVPFFGHVWVVEASKIMEWRLARRGFTVLPMDKWERSGPYELISALNLLDRHNFVEFNDASVSRGRSLPVSEIPTKGSTFEAQVNTLIQNVLRPSGFAVIRWTKLPYLCEGDLSRAFYTLEDAVFLLNATIPSVHQAGPAVRNTEVTQRNEL
uniref:Uncharacterized protein n=1 Tax=Globodera rostochiensis TaxID=31243 RepID=A0A914GU01_GLORO